MKSRSGSRVLTDASGGHTSPTQTGTAWREWSRRERPKVEGAIRGAIPRAGAVPKSLREAMRYSLFPGGKRLRPLIAILGHRACAGASPEIYPLSAACELVHTFTLIHDDLPCMDDDDLRRGRPTCHKAFGEAIAVLAGDSLLNLAYELLAGLRCEPSRKVALVSTLSGAVGGAGVLGGQVEDLEGEGRDLTEAHLRRIHDRKTASLIRASLRMGAILAGARAPRVALLDRFGIEVGHLFQIVDDLLNVEGTEAALGRPAGGDARLKKASYPRILGAEETRRRIRKRAAAAMRAASPFGGMSPLLGDLVETVVARVRCTPGKEAVA